MKKYPHIITAIIISLLMFFMVIIMPKISQIKVEIVKDSGSIELPSEYNLGLNFLGANEQEEYDYGARVDNYRYSWTGYGRKQIEEEALLKNFPLGDKPDYYSRIRLSNQRVFDYLVGPANQMTLKVSDLTNGSIQTGHYQLENREAYYSSISFAEINNHLHLLFKIHPSEYEGDSSYASLVIDLADNQVIDEKVVKLPQNLEGGMSNNLAPSHWKLMQYDWSTSPDREGGQEQISIYLIDPVSLEFEELKNDEGNFSGASYLIKDQLYFINQTDNQGISLERYSIKDRTFHEIELFDDISPSSFSPWHFITAEDYVSLNYIDSNNQGQIRIFSTETYDNIYQGHIEVDSDKLLLNMIY